MSFFMNISSEFISAENQQFVFRTVAYTTLTAICGYGGTFFFTTINPKIGASYIGTIFFISQISYDFFEKLKSPITSPTLKNGITVIQLLQIPLFFYLFHGSSSSLSAAVKLEIISATAYFVAIPVFFHLGIVAWNKPTFTNVATAVGVMLQLASGLGNYAKSFK